MLPARIPSLALLLVLAVLAVPVVHAQETDLVLTVTGDQAPQAEPAADIRLTQARTGQAYAWEINVTEDYAVAEVQLRGAFDVDRGRQIVPLLDGKHLVEVTSRDPSEVDEPARVFNLTGGEGNWTYRLGLPGPGTVNLTLHRDVTPPSFEVGPVTNLTHFSFDLKTSTPEPAMAELVIEGPDRNITYPTNRPGIWQRFPAQGMEPATTYTYHVRFWDFSGNENTSQPRQVTTLPEPTYPTPEVTPVSPVPNTTVPQHRPVVIRAEVTSPDSPILPGDVRLFLDKREIQRAQFQVTEGTVIYQVPGTLEERAYAVSVEVPNQAGGTGIARWSFNVTADEQQAPLGSAPALGALVLTALVAYTWPPGRRPRG